MLEVSYVGDHAVHQLVTRNFNALPNQYLSTTGSRDQTTINLLTGAVPNPFYPLLPGTSLSGTTVARSQLLLPFPQFTGVSAYTNQGYSFYNSMQVRYEKRFKSGLTATASYSWCETEWRHELSECRRPGAGKGDQQCGPAASAGSHVDLCAALRPRQALGQFEPGVVHRSRRMAAAGRIYQAERPAARVWKRHHDVPGKPDILPDDERTIDHGSTRRASTESSAQQLANNLITLSSLFTGVRGDGIRQFDLSILKNTRIREGMNLEIRAEAYNAFNTPMFGPPSTSSPTSTAFGTVTAQFSTARTIQLAA